MKYFALVLALFSVLSFGRAFEVTMSSVPAAYSASNAQSKILTGLGKVKNVCCYNSHASAVVAASWSGSSTVAPSTDDVYIPGGFGICRDMRGTTLYIRGKDGTISSGSLLCDYTLAQ